MEIIKKSCNVIIHKSVCISELYENTKLSEFYKNNCKSIQTYYKFNIVNNKSGVPLYDYEKYKDKTSWNNHIVKGYSINEHEKLIIIYVEDNNY